MFRFFATPRAVHRGFAVPQLLRRRRRPQGFGQLVVVDEAFEVLNRAWCIAEIMATWTEEREGEASGFVWGATYTVWWYQGGITYHHVQCPCVFITESPSVRLVGS